MVVGSCQQQWLYLIPFKNDWDGQMGQGRISEWKLDSDIGIRLAGAYDNEVVRFIHVVPETRNSIHWRGRWAGKGLEGPTSGARRHGPRGTRKEPATKGGEGKGQEKTQDEEQEEALLGTPCIKYHCIMR